MFGLRVLAWSFPATNRGLGPWAERCFAFRGALLGFPLNYKYVVDLMLAGIFGVGLYFWMVAGFGVAFLPLGRAHERLRPVFAVSNFCRKTKMHLLQLHRLPSGHRCDGVCRAGHPHGGSPMRSVQRLRGGLSLKALVFGATQGSNPPKIRPLSCIFGSNPPRQRTGFSGSKVADLNPAFYAKTALILHIFI